MVELVEVLEDRFSHVVSFSNEDIDRLVQDGKQCWRISFKEEAFFVDLIKKEMRT